MIKISDSIKEIVINQPFLRFGLHHRLVNLSSIARFIKPLVEARTKKEVRQTAILMNLSRLQKTLAQKSIEKKADFSIINLVIHSGLCSITFTRSKEVYNQLNKFYGEVQNQNGYITFSQGISEITVITNESFLPTIKNIINAKPKYIKAGLSSIGVQFNADYSEVPGLFYFLTQQLTLQNINISEISSTYTELIFYINQKDMRLAFDTLSRVLNQKQK
jgi:aspartokinase